MSEIYEVQEQEIDFAEEFNGGEAVDTESEGGKGLAVIVVGSILLLGGLAVAGIKKLKNKKAEETDKPKTKLKLFARVPVEEPVEEICEDEEFDEEVENQ